ncbi:hypothetical protein JM18_007899 [Phytophthora kernoviae]|uniref:SAM domain-containing protein n=2 Tax=Phytophthora kernoviae TaxID=325452 RepID=A0A921SC11_9STRA|nr:hypothetical protein G195_009383 [Phytophthora kernoviae 00238/432]KAG2516810.1 hypothetical protein JM18_007899 [Phytophthora kernoviae]
MNFSPMDVAGDAPTGCARAVVKTVVALSLPFVLSPREVASEAVTNVAAAFTTCFSRLRQRRPQFDEEQKEALLSEDERFSEAAMMELRRRVMESGVSATPAMRPEKEQEVFTTLATDTEKALDQILEATKSRKHSKSSETLDVEAVRRLSPTSHVDELLAHGSIGHTTPEKTGVEPVLLDLQDDEEYYNNVDSGPLHEWLASIDASRADEYCVYVKQLQQHGFLTLADLAQLESDDDVDQAMSEVGIAKFAHRLRIRKAIQRLHSPNEDSASVVPVAASA